MKIFLFGISLTLVSWIFAWGRFSLISQYIFPFLWLGFIFTVNGFSQLFIGKSLLFAMGKKFILLFLISIIFWWLFEFLNQLTHNWQYHFVSTPTPFQYFVWASLSFSTVIPATLSTSFLFFNIASQIKPFCSSWLTFKGITILIFLELGALSFLLIFLFPQFFYPLLWGGVFFLTEPLNYLFKFPSIFSHINQGNWTLVVSIALAALFTGFWWEMWNFYSFPKWTYSVPFVDFFKIFEMPILGYIGYLFFGLEIYSFTTLCFGILKKFNL